MFLRTHLKAMTIGVLWGAVLVGGGWLVVMRAGWNMGFKDRSLTEPQMMSTSAISRRTATTAPSGQLSVLRNSS